MNMHLSGLHPVNPAFAGQPRADLYTEAHITDAAIKDYYDAAETGTTFIIYGDHGAYGLASAHVPFIVAVKGTRLPQPQESYPVYAL